MSERDERGPLAGLVGFGEPTLGPTEVCEVAGVDREVGDRLWRGVRDGMLEKLRAGAPREAIIGAIEGIGHELARHYPRRPGDTNELGDEVSVS